MSKSKQSPLIAESKLAKVAPESQNKIILVLEKMCVAFVAFVGFVA